MRPRCSGRCGWRRGVAAALLALASWGAAADPFGNWSLFGSNTIRLEDYKIWGDATASPYPHEGWQAYDEFAVNLTRRDSPYDIWRAQVYGVVNASDYRSTDYGIVPERLNLTREKGDGGLPWRLEVGDYFGFLSYRTLQRSLKGAQIELQPAGASGRHPSLLLFAGTNQPSWRDLDFSEDLTAGVSWLVDNEAAGRYALNLLHNRRDAAAAALARSQWVASLAGLRDFVVDKTHYEIDGELAAFSGDHDGTTGAASGQGRQDFGAYLQLARRSVDPLTWRLRYDHYGQDYRPAGAVVSPDRRSVEGHIGWRFDSGLALRGRALWYRDGLETSNPTDTSTLGVSFSGPLHVGEARGLTGTIDTFVQDQHTRDLTVDNRAYTATVNMMKPLGSWVGQLGLFLQLLDSYDANPDSHTWQAVVSANHAIELGGFRGMITPGLLYRQVSGGTGASRDWSPTLAFALVRGPHQLRANLTLLDQNPTATSTVASATASTAVDYRYTAGQHTLGVELNSHSRNVSTGADTEAMRIAAFWSYVFERPARMARTASSAAPQLADRPLAAGAGLLLGLAPGMALDRALGRIADAGFASATQLPGVLVYEARVLEEIEQRQRLAVTHYAGSVEQSVLVVDFDDSGNRDTVAQTFERVRKLLLDRYGRPDFAFDQGEFGANFMADVNAGRLIRIMEWASDSGRIRLGVPRRLDGQVRIEIQHARTFREAHDTLWGLDAVR